MLVKKLTRQGNSTSLVIDRQLMELLDLDRDALVKVSVEGRKLIVEPLSEADRKAAFTKIMHATGKQNAELFRRLAK
jgi:antitoxin component of MazEF toxin-antitoxin module